MQYLGGKSQNARKICDILRKLRKPGMLFTDVFVGGASVVSRMDGERRAHDVSPALITLYRAWQNGWRPGPIDQSVYNRLKRTQNPRDPMTAFAGFGCSFAGRWFSSYARDTKGYDYAKAAASSLGKKMKNMADVRITCRDYRSIEVKGLLYCDPPYAGTTPYTATGVRPFCSGTFWATMRDWVETGAIVVVSEYRAPEDFTCVRHFPLRKDQLNKTNIDRVFMHNSQLHLLGAEQSADLT